MKFPTVHDLKFCTVSSGHYTEMLLFLCFLISSCPCFLRCVALFPHLTCCEHLWPFPSLLCHTNFSRLLWASLGTLHSHSAYRLSEILSHRSSWLRQPPTEQCTASPSPRTTDYPVLRSPVQKHYAATVRCLEIQSSCRLAVSTELPMFVFVRTTNPEVHCLSSAAKH